MANGYTKVPIWIPTDKGGALRCEVSVINTNTVRDGVKFWFEGDNGSSFVIPFHKLESAYLQNKYYRDKIAESKPKKEDSKLDTHYLGGKK